MHGLFAQCQRALAGQALCQLCGELAHRRAVLRTERWEILHHQPAGQRDDAKPNEADEREVERLAERAGFLPRLLLLFATEQQEVARAVADNERPEIVEEQHRPPFAEPAGAERRVERHEHATTEEERVHQAEEQVREEAAGGAHVSESRRPTDADKRERQQRGEGEQQHAALGAEQQVVLLRAQLGVEPLAEADAQLRRSGERVEEIQQQTHAAPRGEASEETQVEKLAAFYPHERDEQEWREADYRPVVREAQAAREGEAGEPFVVAALAEFQQARDGGGEEQEVECLAGRGGGVFPEAELQAAREHGEERRKPVRGDGEQAGFVSLARALVAGAVLRQERDAAGEERECECGAEGGEGVQREELRAGWERLHRQREQVVERAANFRVPPVPAEDLCVQAERRQRDPRSERDEVERERGPGDDPREECAGEVARRRSLIVHASNCRVRGEDRQRPQRRQGTCEAAGGSGTVPAPVPAQRSRLAHG